MGSEGIAAAIHRTRARVKAAGFLGLFLIGTVGADRDEQARLSAEGYDAGTGYNYPRAGMQDESGIRGSYDAAVDGYERIWLDIAKAAIRTMCR